MKDFSVANEKKVGWDGDVPFVDDGWGGKVYEIPVEWLVSDVVKIRANSLEEAIKTFMEEEYRIPTGSEPEYVDGSYRMSVSSEQTFENIDNIVKELEDNFGDSIENDYDEDGFEM